MHLYRGELGRLTTYRVRLDTTTNWALGTNVAVMTFTLGQPDAPHLVLLLPYVLTACFAVVESRRFQEMDSIRCKVRLLERGLFAPMLGAPNAEPADWAERLYERLLHPEITLSFWTALGHRTRRNYMWIFLTLYGAWWLKVWLASIAQGFNYAPFPSPLVVGLSLVLMLPWITVFFVRESGGRHTRTVP